VQSDSMTGAESVVRTLVSGGVRVCFANPGTSEIHFVAALARIKGIRPVLALFEGVATGAADGYFRMSGLPAATLLHLGPGLANGLANLHNAKKARSGIVNIVGQHATHHLGLDSPLASDVDAIARPFSDWIRVAEKSASVASDCALAIEEARRPLGQIATLIVPADTAWGAAAGHAMPNPPSAPSKVSGEAVKIAAIALRQGSRPVMILGGAAVRGRALELAGQIAAKTGCELMCEHLNARAERGAGRVPIARIPYAVDQAIDTLRHFKEVILVGAKLPVAFFASPNKPSLLTPPDATITQLANIDDDVTSALESLASEANAVGSPPRLAQKATSTLPTGRVTLDGIGAVLACLMPTNAIVVDESLTTGRTFWSQLAGANPHDWLNSMGGSIGFGLPLAVGAAVASPDRKVITLEGDGSAMYTLQAMWTMAREQLNITMVIFANRAYRILHGELASLGVGTPSGRALDLLTLDRPNLDWVYLARGQGVDAGRATDINEFTRELRRAFDSTGPYLIELII
jgi:acetolactate synthase-1/2/3 large subunit